MLSPLARRVVRGALAFAVTISVTALGVAVANADTAPRPALTALSFEQPTVDATSGGWVFNTLTWTVSNTDPDSYVNGVVTLRMRSSVTGELLGHERTATYWFNDACCMDAQFVSGTTEESTYSYRFPVPHYSDAETATWEVTKVTIVSGATTTAVGGTRLQRLGYRFTARTLIDTTGPSVEFESRSNPYVYAGSGPTSIGFPFIVRDAESGFWKGRIRLAGPGGNSVTTHFTWERDGLNTGIRCGGGNDPVSGGGEVHCSIGVALPAGAPDGTWRVTQVVLHDNAGVVATHNNPAAPTVIVTSNSKVQAGDFLIDPNPVDNWRDDAVTELSMAVTGARRGIASVTVDFALHTPSCHATGPATVRADGRVAVPLIVGRGISECRVEGIRLIDGAGNVALYGRKYLAPDPGLVITQVPHTATPPVVLGATLTPSSLPASQTAGGSTLLTVRTEPQAWPVSSVDAYIYDAAGEVVGSLISGFPQTAGDGTVRQGLFLSTMAPGEYTVGFELRNGPGSFSAWNIPDHPDSRPLPGGPLILTVTDG
ncbi:hypothetical protein [Actinophytocola sp.]|uniref:hypothetical protein n=1 Tax=Actinophytocola sp. TaxID=1872138 RepID=UPI002D80628E|nr:hypothetical protein [Actinophytocola sp.]HET9144330.1 hypothetical protein [Actinophytocola sp.]